MLPFSVLSLNEVKNAIVLHYLLYFILIYYYYITRITNPDFCYRILIVRHHVVIEFLLSGTMMKKNGRILMKTNQNSSQFQVAMKVEEDEDHDTSMSSAGATNAATTAVPTEATANVQTALVTEAATTAAPPPPTEAAAEARPITTTTTRLVRTAEATLPSSPQPKWSFFSSMIHPRSNFASITTNGRIYIFGGVMVGTTSNSHRCKKAEMYDPETGSWMELPDMKKERSHCSCAAIGNHIYVLGGRVGCMTDYEQHSDCGEIFNVVTQSWSKMKSAMTQKRESHSMISHGTKLIVFGGDRYHKGIAEVYDSVTDEWKLIAAMMYPRIAMGAAVIDNKIYAIGGRTCANIGNAKTKTSDIIEIYDIEKNQWTVSQTKIRHRRHQCSAIATGSTITVIGGFDHRGFGVVPIEAYHIEKGEWTGSVIHPVKRERSGFVTKLWKGSDFITIGGTTCTGHDGLPRLSRNFSNLVEVYRGATELISRAETEGEISIPLTNLSVPMKTRNTTSQRPGASKPTKPKRTLLGETFMKTAKRQRQCTMKSSELELSEARPQRKTKSKEYEFKARKVAKKFPSGLFIGKIQSYNEKKGWWQVKYEDGDTEDMNRNEVIKGLERYEKSIAKLGTMELSELELSEARPQRKIKSEEYEFKARKIAKNFSSGIAIGKIQSYDEKKGWWQVEYEDGDTEDMKRNEVIKGLKRYERSIAKYSSQIPKEVILQNQNGPIPELDCAIHAFASIRLNGRLYIFGGVGNQYRSKDAQCYDEHNNVWIQLAKMKRARSGCSCVAIGDNIYVIGGYTDQSKCGSNSIDIYNIKKDTWTESSYPMAIKRVNHISVAVGTKIYVFGGGFGDCDRGEVFDTVKKKWAFLNGMLQDRRSFSAVAIGNSIYAFGGTLRKEYLSLNKRVLDSIEIYNVTTNKWRKSTERLKQRRCNCTVVAMGSTIAVIGGKNGSTLTPSIELFHCKDSFRSLGCISGRKNSVERAGSAVGLTDDKNLLVFGGTNSPTIMGQSRSLKSVKVIQNFSKLVEQKVRLSKPKKLSLSIYDKTSSTIGAQSHESNSFFNSECEIESETAYSLISPVLLNQRSFSQSRNNESNAFISNRIRCNTQDREENEDQALSAETKFCGVQDIRIQTIEDVLNIKLAKVAELESKAFGEVKTGALQHRIEALQKLLGIQLTF